MHDFPLSFGHHWPSPPPKGWKSSHDDWGHFGKFVASLRWKQHADLRVSYNELAVLFVYRKFKRDCLCDEFCTFAQLTGWLNGSFAVCRRRLEQDLFPGMHEGHIAHTWGKSMPPGSICGGRPFMSDDELLFLSLFGQYFEACFWFCYVTMELSCT